MATDEMAAGAVAPPRSERDAMPIHGIDHVEFYAGNAAQAAHFFTTAYGFTETAYSGLEAGRRDRRSYVLEQGRIRLVVTGALRGTSEIAEACTLATATVSKDIALSGAGRAVRPTARGRARGTRGPSTPQRAGGRPRRSGSPRSPPTGTRSTCSCSARATRAPSCPATRSAGRSRADPDDLLLMAIDHIVGNVELGHMDEWVSYYERVFGMTEMIHFSDEAVSTEYSALMSKVVTDGSGRLSFRSTSPPRASASSDRGVIDFTTAPARSTSRWPRATSSAAVQPSASGGGVPPHPRGAYYDEVPGRIGDIEEDVEDLKRRAASWSTATTRATCCRSSRSRSATGRRCSSRSSSATARAASARGTSRRCSRRSSASRTGRGNLL